LKIYLDACCYNRPFDDQTQDRVRLESEAVLLILVRVQRGHWELLRSDVLEYEVAQMPDRERYHRVMQLIGCATHVVHLDETQIRRGEVLSSKGFGDYDALHLAAAEAGKANLFLTTDDRLLGAARRHAGELQVQVKNPLTWLQEVTRE